MGETLEILSERDARLGPTHCHLMTADEVEVFWPEMQKELLTISHLWEMWWTIESFHFMVLNGHMQVWVVGTPPTFHLILITQICHYPAGPVLQAVLTFGSQIDSVLDLVVGTLEHFAEKNGCKYTEVFGRPGWKRKLNRFGYRDSTRVFVKPIGELRRH